MKLIELFEVLKDTTKVSVFNSYSEGNFLLGDYDGKNSIDEKYNDQTIEEIEIQDNTLIVSVYENVEEK